MNRKVNTPIGQMLVEQGVISQDQLTQALEEQKRTGQTIGQVLVSLGFIERESEIIPHIAHQMGVDFVKLAETHIPPDVLSRIPAKLVNHYQVIPIRLEGDLLYVAMSNPTDVQVLDDLQLMVKIDIEPVLTSDEEIDDAIRKYYGVGAEMIEDMMESKGLDIQEASQVSEIEEMGSEASISKFLNQILLEAYRDRATDIHIEPFEDEVTVRYRIDGVLYDAKVPENMKFFQDALISRIKIMSNLNIVEKRLPQDGRFKMVVEDVDLDLRVSFLPTPQGQSAVIRILSAIKLLSLEELGLTDDELVKINILIKKPYGIIFFTGPTGSGKTTSLYSCLSQVNNEDNKIITIEDPIEYKLKGITQIQINPEIGLTFAAGLRSMLRHDPDIMMVGEVRDFEAAQITMQAALTGHLVLSTLHTNDAASAIARLMDMGVEPYLISSSVQCFIAQRLVRKICPSCRRTQQVSSDIAQDFGVKLSEPEITIYEGEGCDKCRQTGYIGREAIDEFLMVDDEIRQLILDRASAKAIKDKAIELGMKTLRMHGWEKVLKGITTPSEVLRVTHEDDVEIE